MEVCVFYILQAERPHVESYPIHQISLSRIARLPFYVAIFNVFQGYTGLHGPPGKEGFQGTPVCDFDLHPQEKCNIKYLLMTIIIRSIPFLLVLKGLLGKKVSIYMHTLMHAKTHPHTRAHTHKPPPPTHTHTQYQVYLQSSPYKHSRMTNLIRWMIHPQMASTQASIPMIFSVTSMNSFSIASWDHARDRHTGALIDDFSHQQALCI